MSTDPATAKYPSWSPYNFSLNNPIIFNDPDGEKPRVTVVNNEDGSVTIKIVNTLFVVTRGKQAKASPIDPVEINKYLRSGSVKLGDKNVSIEIETQIVNVKNKKQAILGIKNNGDFGVIVNQDTRRLTALLSGTGGRSYHTNAEDTKSGYDELTILRGFSSTLVQAHELGHDLGFEDKYVDVEGLIFSQAMLSFSSGALMVGNGPLSDYELSILADDVLNGNSVEETGRPVNSAKDRVPEGAKIMVVQLDKKGKADPSKAFEVEITNSGGTPHGKKTDAGASTENKPQQ